MVPLPFGGGVRVWPYAARFISTGSAAFSVSTAHAPVPLPSLSSRSEPSIATIEFAHQCSPRPPDLCARVEKPR